MALISSSLLTSNNNISIPEGPRHPHWLHVDCCRMCRRESEALALSSCSTFSLDLLRSKLRWTRSSKAPPHPLSPYKVKVLQFQFHTSVSISYPPHLPPLSTCLIFFQVPVDNRVAKEISGVKSRRLAAIGHKILALLNANHDLYSIHILGHI